MKSAIPSLWLFLLAGSLPVQAQDLRFERFNTENGLSQNTILSLLQDSRGHLWIGTEEGLNKYNGYDFMTYHDVPGDSASLADDMIWSLLESPDGTIWAGHTKGISTIGLDGQIRNFITDDGLTAFSSHVDADTTIWFGTAGQGIIRISNGQVVRYKNVVSAPAGVNPNTWELVANYVICFLRDRQQRLWLGTRGGGVFLFQNGTFVRPSLAEGDEKFFSTGDFWSLTEDKQGNLYFGSTRGLAIADKDFSQIEYYDESNGLASPRIARLLDQDDHLWIATYGGGLHHFDKKTRKITAYRHNESDIHSVSSDITFSLLLDRQENLWVGTWAAGLNRLNKDATAFRNYCGGNIVFGLAQSNGRLWVGTYDKGILSSDIPPGGELSFNPVRTSPSIYTNGLGAGKQGLWIATDGHGIAKLDDKNNLTLFGRIPGNHHSLQNNLVNAVVEDPEGYVWATTRGSGLARLDPSKKYGTPGSVIHYSYRERDPQSLSHNYTGALLYDADKRNLWVSNSKGLCRLDNPSEGDSLSSFVRFDCSGVNTIYKSSSGKIWVGTSHGLMHFDGEKLVSLEDSKGINVADIREGNEGVLYVSTTTGLLVVSESAKKFFNSHDGLPHDEFNARASCTLPDGRVVFGTTNGITAFHPEDLLKPAAAPHALVHGMRFLNKDYEELSEEQREGIHWNPGSVLSVSLAKEINVFDVYCFSDDLSDPVNGFFYYKLEGFDKDWNRSVPPEHEFSYTNLDPGEYTFHVKACSDPGNCQQVATTVMITVLPAWWQTLWAYSGYSLLAAGLLVLGRRNIVQRERLKSRMKLDQLELEKLKELDDFKSKFFANISHEFRTPLTLIMGIAEELQSKNGTSHEALQSIRRNGSGLLNLVNQMLDLSRVDAGKLQLNPQAIRLVEFLKMHVRVFESLASQRGLTLHQSYPGDEREVTFDPSVMEKILNNLLSNAIKYTPQGGEIFFEAGFDAKLLILQVRDTGVGISEENLGKIFDRFFRVSEESEGTGIGLALTQELVKIHGGHIRVESEVSRGTTFRVEIPVETKEVYTGDVKINGQLTESRHAGHEEPDFSWTETADGKPILLIVEDNEELRSFLKRNLKEDYHVEVTASGEEGLRKASVTLPDVIITDWMMPGMGGLAFCSAIKSSEATSHIPVIMLTARAGSDSRIEGWEAGADDYLTKPFEMAELRVRVSSLVRQREVLREKYAANGIMQYNHVKVSSLDKQFLQRFHATLEEKHSDSSLSVEAIAREMGVGRVQLHRKLTALTGYSASDLLRDFRLHRAADLLRQKAGNVSEVAFRVGFENLSYFTKTFKEKFGSTPSGYVSI